MLVADDDRGIREGLAARFLQAGFEVVCAGDARGAIELYDNRRPDAAMLDVQMPGIDGFAVCEHIRAGGGIIPVFFLTGATDGVISHHLPTLTRTVGGTHFITKPYDGKTVVLMVRKAIEDAQTHAPTAA